MISYETINARLGFDYLEAERKYIRSLPDTEYDDIFSSPVYLLTPEELDFVVADLERQMDA